MFVSGEVMLLPPLFAAAVLAPNGLFRLPKTVDIGPFPLLLPALGCAAAAVAVPVVVGAAAAAADMPNGELTASGCIAFVVFVPNKLLLPLPLPKMCNGAVVPALVAGLLAKGVAAANGVAAFDVVAVGHPKLLAVVVVAAVLLVAAPRLPAVDVAAGLGPPKLNVDELAKLLLMLLLALALALMLLTLPKVNSGVLLLVGVLKLLLLLLLTAAMEPKIPLLPVAAGDAAIVVVAVDVVAGEPKKKLLVLLLVVLLLLKVVVGGFAAA